MQRRISFRMNKVLKIKNTTGPVFTTCVLFPQSHTIWWASALLASRWPLLISCPSPCRPGDHLPALPVVGAPPGHSGHRRSVERHRAVVFVRHGGASVPDAPADAVRAPLLQVQVTATTPHRHCTRSRPSAGLCDACVSSVTSPHSRSRVHACCFRRGRDVKAVAEPQARGWRDTTDWT